MSCFYVEVGEGIEKRQSICLAAREEKIYKRTCGSEVGEIFKEPSE